MKYLLLVLYLSLCSHSFCQTQTPDLIIPIDFTFQLAPPFHMQVGLDSSATDCIDTQLGESQLPPIPPPGWNGVITLPYPQCQGGYGEAIIVQKDFRFGELPFTGTKTHTFWFRPDLGLTIHWNLPNRVTGLLKDTYGGGLISVQMTGKDSFYVSYSINEIIMVLTYNNVVPVQLTDFTASVLLNDNTIQLNWITATETNNFGFEIERLKDRTIQRFGEWETIGFIEGHGTSSQTHSYSFNDNELLSGKVNYRLKQIDFDGTFEYSNEMEVNADFTPKEFVLHQNYPNPFNPDTKIEYVVSTPSFVNISVYDILGNKIKEIINEQKDPGNYDITFNGAALSSGIYYYKMTTGNFTSVKKMSLLK